MPTRKRKKNIHPHRYWTKQEEALLLKYYVNKGPDWCATALSAKGLDRTKVAVENRAHKMGLYYCGEPIGRYKKGHVPASKGKKMSAEQYKRCKATMFKPGDRPENRVPIGHETIRNDGYTYVKVAEKKWVFKHRMLWEKHNGPVPAGHIVAFRDGNPHNFLLDNLELITRKENVRRNRWGAGPSQYSLISGRAAHMRLRKRGIGRKAVRDNPQLLDLAKAETLLKLKTRKRHGNHSAQS